MWVLRLALIVHVGLLLSVTGHIDSTTEATQSPRPRPSVPAETRIGVQGLIVTMHGKAVASATIRAKRADQPCAGANAEFMSVGPLGPLIQDPMVRPPGFIVEGSRRRLRVTISTSERIAMLTVDDILTSGADSRRVVAEYQISPFGDLSDLWDALQRAPRVLGPDPTGPPIVWHGPTAFSWITRSDTLVLEQKDDFLFEATLRARVR